jgi:hypothetical protein
LEDMRKSDSPFATVPAPGDRAFSLADNCANMLERARALWPNSSVTIVRAPGVEVPDGKVAWTGGTDTKTFIKQGGGEAALGKLKALLADVTRPWYHGAAHVLFSRQQPTEQA